MSRVWADDPAPDGDVRGQTDEEQDPPDRCVQLQRPRRVGGDHDADQHQAQQRLVLDPRRQQRACGVQHKTSQQVPDDATREIRMSVHGVRSDGDNTGKRRRGRLGSGEREPARHCSPGRDGGGGGHHVEAIPDVEAIPGWVRDPRPRPCVIHAGRG